MSRRPLFRCARPRTPLTTDIAEAAARRYQQDQLARFLDELDAEHGPVPERVRRDVATWWPDADRTR